MLLGQYQHIPQQEETVNCTFDGSVTGDGIRVIRQSDAKYDLLLNNRDGSDIDADTLLRHIELALSQSRPPQVSLTIDLFYEHNPDKTAKPGKSITVALPRFKLSSSSNQLRTLYCRADDVPCLRGGSRTFTSLLHNLEDFTQPWTMKSVDEPLGVVSSRVSAQTEFAVVEAAEANAKAQWNLRCDRNLCAPWKPLSEHPESPVEDAALDATSPHGNSPWHNQASRHLALDAVKRFLSEKTSYCKYLVLPESTFGWDILLLEDQVRRDLLSAGILTSSQDGPADDNITTIASRASSRFAAMKLRIEPLPPAFAVRLLPSWIFEDVLLRSRWVFWPSFYIPFVFLKILTWLIAVSILFACGEGILIILVSVLALAPLYALIYVSLHLNSSYSSIHEPIGSTWALKRWTRSTGLKTREDALNSVSDATDAHQNGDGSWSILAGMDELDWWQANRHAIESAIKRNHQGILFIDEVHTARGVDWRSAVPVIHASSSSHGVPPPEYGDVPLSVMTDRKV